MTWGFDGTSIAPGFFNPLTIVVRNDSAAPVDDTLLLLESNGLRGVGAPLAERCYLTPGAQRVVQFHPFVTSAAHTWSLRWGNAVARIDVRPRPSVAWRGLVVLREDAQTGREHKLATFPASWFPAIPGAAEALAEAVLDFAPEWDEGRAGAFLAWVRGGGRLHLLERDGRQPTFTGVLALLNDPRQHFGVGAGTVARYAAPLSERTAPLLVRLPAPPDEAHPPSESSGPSVLSQLQMTLLPTHPWGLIFLAAFAFLVCVGPVHWHLARKRIDWRLSIGYLLAIVTLFTLLFGWLGARGYDEVSRIRTLAYARLCGDGEVAVTQYTNAFVTGGGRRQFRPRAPASLLSTAQMHESVDGMIDNGSGASLMVNMPMFSARGFVHRGHYLLEHTPTLHAGDAPRQFVFAGSDGNPIGGLLLEGGRLWHLLADGPNLTVTQTVDDGQPTRFDAAYPTRAATFDPRNLISLLPEVACERLQLAASSQRYADVRTKRAFILVRAPSELHLDAASNLGTEDSYVLYDFDLDR